MSEQILSKQCTKCKQTLPLSEFHKNRSTKDGLHSWCKSCEGAYQKAYLQSEKGMAVHRRYLKSPKGKSAVVNYRRSPNGKAANRKGNAKFYASNPNIHKANHAVNDAIAAGKMARAQTQRCYYCLSQAQQYHHWHGYETECWLDVVPVCIDCHKKEHRKTA